MSIRKFRVARGQAMALVLGGMVGAASCGPSSTTSPPHPPAVSAQPTAAPAPPPSATNQMPGQAPVLTPLAADVDNICNVLERSGAINAPPGERGVHTAVWLGKNVHSAEGKKFLEDIQPLTGVAKADALDGMALAMGLVDCPLSAQWRK
ncbi:MAG: hypothetical protein IPL79_13280 [Myxococcales bacterium]|nr:hypothetical protein [Myxococcales bacterium]